MSYLVLPVILWLSAIATAVAIGKAKGRDAIDSGAWALFSPAAVKNR